MHFWLTYHFVSHESGQNHWNLKKKKFRSDSAFEKWDNFKNNLGHIIFQEYSLRQIFFYRLRDDFLHSHLTTKALNVLVPHPELILQARAHLAVALRSHISEVTKSHPKGNDDIKFSIDWFHRWIEAIKMKLLNSTPSQVNVRIVKIE